MTTLLCFCETSLHSFKSLRFFKLVSASSLSGSQRGPRSDQQPAVTRFIILQNQWPPPLLLLSRSGSVSPLWALLKVVDEGQLYLSLYNTRFAQWIATVAACHCSVHMSMKLNTVDNVNYIRKHLDDTYSCLLPYIHHWGDCDCKQLYIFRAEKHVGIKDVSHNIGLQSLQLCTITTFQIWRIVHNTIITFSPLIQLGDDL